MTMDAATATGLLLGLGAAVGASVAYVFGRRFMTRGGAGILRLLVQAHLVMALLAMGFLPWLPASGWPGWSSLALPVGITLGCYLLGQVLLFTALKGVEPSRAAPLLGAKIVALALILALVLGRPPRPGQWLGVLAAAAGIFVLGGAGVPLARRQVAGVLVACLCYAGSDLGAKVSVDVLVAGGVRALPAALAVTVLVHLAAGLVALVLLPVALRGERRDWAIATGYAGCWFTSLVCLFGAFVLVGVVPGAIMQSFRGVISVLLGAALARLGWRELEARVAPGVVVRRLVGAGLMVGAVAAWVGFAPARSGPAPARTSPAEESP